MISRDTTSSTARIAPSTTLTPFWTRIANAITDSSDSGASRLSTVEWTMIGVARAAMPSTSVRFATFEPTMLPMAMSSEPCEAARAETSSSGALVPKPITTAPITTVDSRRTVARRAAPTTNWSAA
jgi:hypothetical protein